VGNGRFGARVRPGRMSDRMLASSQRSAQLSKFTAKKTRRSGASFSVDMNFGVSGVEVGKLRDVGPKILTQISDSSRDDKIFLA
jgi:hypothetical protein